DSKDWYAVNEVSKRPYAGVESSAPALPCDMAQIVGELSLDDGGGGIGGIGLAVGDSGLRHFLRHVEPDALERHPYLESQRLGGCPLFAVGEDRVEHDAVAGPQHALGAHQES